MAERRAGARAPRPCGMSPPIAADARHDIDGQHQRRGDQQARHDRRDEQRADRDRGQRGVDDQPEAGRDQVGERRRPTRSARSAEGAVVAALRHLRHHQLGDRRSVGRRRARDAGQHGVGDDVGLAEPAAQMPDQLASPRSTSRGVMPPAFITAAARMKNGNGQQRERVQRRRHVLRDGDQQDLVPNGAKAAKAPKAIAKATGVPSMISTRPTILSTMALPLSP